MKKIETLALDIVACSNFVELYYSVKSTLLVGCIDGRNYLDGKALDALSFQDFCELLLILNKHGWNLSEEKKKDYVVLTK